MYRFAHLPCLQTRVSLACGATRQLSKSFTRQMHRRSACKTEGTRGSRCRTCTCTSYREVRLRRAPVVTQCSLRLFQPCMWICAERTLMNRTAVSSKECVLWARVSARQRTKKSNWQRATHHFPPGSDVLTTMHWTQTRQDVVSLRAPVPHACTWVRKRSM